MMINKRGKGRWENRSTVNFAVVEDWRKGHRSVFEPIWVAEVGGGIDSLGRGGSRSAVILGLFGLFLANAMHTRARVNRVVHRPVRALAAVRERSSKFDEAGV
jgi:hypothetical protein